MIREARGLSLSDLAERAELSKGYVSRVEHGARLASVFATGVLADALDVAPEVLTGQFPPYRTLRHMQSDLRFDELAMLLDVDVDELTRIELGAVEPTEAQLARMAKLYGVPAELLRPQD